MSLPEIVSLDEWWAARKDLMTREKEMTRARDKLVADRRRESMQSFPPLLSKLSMKASMSSESRMDSSGLFVGTLQRFARWTLKMFRVFTSRAARCSEPPVIIRPLPNKQSKTLLTPCAASE